jgi:hypothetical protein
MTYIPAKLRRLVTSRANDRCEYCLIRNEDHYLPHEADHILSEKHRGETTAKNLCLSCFDCNRYKGSDVGSFDLETGRFFPLYNPRTMQWSDHFRLDDARIIPLTPEGRITEFLLRLNSPDRIVRRQALVELKRYSDTE